jgi:large subunit ribosomal protein L6
MSRKGKLPILVPKGVEVKITPIEIIVKGPKGTLHQKLIPSVQVRQEQGTLYIELAPGYEQDGRFHGLYRTLIANMVEGTTKGFSKELEMVGVGYRAAVQGHHIDLQIGRSHPTKLSIPEGIQVKVEKSTAISITGVDKGKVGHFAAVIRAEKPPEPYQGKGIRYKGEYVRKKAGKAAAAKK